jgi:hypothetical protein
MMYAPLIVLYGRDGYETILKLVFETRAPSDEGWDEGVVDLFLNRYRLGLGLVFKAGKLADLGGGPVIARAFEFEVEALGMGVLCTSRFGPRCETLAALLTESYISVSTHDVNFITLLHT